MGIGRPKRFPQPGQLRGGRLRPVPEQWKPLVAMRFLDIRDGKKGYKGREIQNGLYTLSEFIPLKNILRYLKTWKEDVNVVGEEYFLKEERESFWTDYLVKNGIVKVSEENGSIVVNPDFLDDV